MGNNQGLEINATAAFGRRPNDHELMILYQLQKRLFTQLRESPEHLALLKRYWDLHFTSKANAPAFARKNPFWSNEGGFSSENPADDLRDMGELGLRCLLYFTEMYPGEARMMKRSRGGYPFVKAAMATTRALCEILRIVDEEGHSGVFPVTRTLYWQVLESETAFCQLFALLFLLFDELFCEEVAKQWRLQDEIECAMSVVTQLVEAAKKRMLCELLKAPLGISGLHGVCKNAHHVLQATKDIRCVSNPHASTDTVQQASRWRKYNGTQRKNMRDAGKHWRIDEKNASECLDRLQPRQPEISFSPSVSKDVLSVTTTKAVGDSEWPNDGEEKEKDEEELDLDLFKGLVVTQPYATRNPVSTTTIASLLKKEPVVIHEHGMPARTG
uniref:ELMO domain-containing protein n=1 Tax=Globisporangium ultimum (strain ATCC 200006 / CBS 805.95 / DAOM BR144) TaxID=431595 RepID=K3XAR6_GLOUD